MAQTIDLAPTVLELARVDLSTGTLMMGVPLLSSILSPSASGRDAVAGQRYVRTSTHKLMVEPPSEDGTQPGSVLYRLTDGAWETDGEVVEEPEVQAGLLARWKAALEESFELRRASRRSAPPPGPFYLTMGDVTLRPPAAVRLQQEPEPVVPDERWSMSQIGNRMRLVHRKGKAPGLSVTAGVPNGAYRLYAIIEAPEDGPDPAVRVRHPGKTGPETARPAPSSPAVAPHLLSPRSRIRLFDLGEARAEKEAPSFDLGFHGGADDVVVIHGFAFEPAGGAGIRGRPMSGPTEEALKALRNAGYLDDDPGVERARTQAP